MPRFFMFMLVALAVGLGRPAVAADGIPARPVPFTFVTDQANLLAPADAKKLDNGLRKYADNTGTQVVVVTVPSLGGTDVADYARQLGTSWGVGQRGKNNGIVVLLSGKEHQMSIEAGSGLRSAITPELTKRVMSEMTPDFKQNSYFTGLRKGLNTLMLAANPSSDPRKNRTSSSAATAATTSANTPDATSTNLDNETTPAAADVAPVTPMASEPASSPGLGIGTLLIGALVIGGGIWLLKRQFSRSSNSAGTSQNQAPDFMGNRPSGSTPNFGAPNAGYPQGNYGGQAPSSGSGIGGMLATGAAAAAGAYLGNRMAEGHESSASAPHNFDAGTGTGAVPPATAGSDYFASRNDAADNSGPDYFSGNDSTDNSGDYFSGDNSSYDDSSSSDTGGGGFDSSDDTKGSW